MTEGWVLISLVGMGVGVWALGRQFAKPDHAPVDVAGLGTLPGIVVFTSDACPDCLVALDLAERSGLAVRRVRYETEPDQFGARRVSGVPILVVVDQLGQPVAQFSGKIPPRRLERAVQRALLSLDPPRF